MNEKFEIASAVDALSIDGEVCHNTLQTIIDGLSAHVAVLDHDAVIVAVNRAWRQFADENGGTLSSYGLGRRYMELCSADCVLDPHDLAALKGDDLGKAAAVGMLRVLHGYEERFQLTYPCHGREEKRWFMLTATPLPLNGKRGLIVAHENVTTLVQRQEAITAALMGTVNAIADIAEVRDPYTAGHQRAVARLASGIAQQLSLDSETRRGVELGGLIHDIGKIAIPAEILTRPGRLSHEEMMLIRTHPATGHGMVTGIPFPWPLADIILQHHERIDGSGYPQGLRGDEIRLEARIIAVADVVDAMASHRPYRPALGVVRATQEIRAGMGCRYDQDVARAYLSSEVQELALAIYEPTRP